MTRQLAIATIIGAVLAQMCPVDAAEPTSEIYLVHAREAASNDEHGQAIDLYKRAIAADPSLRINVATELGHQYTWAEKPDSAIAWYCVAVYARPWDIDAHLGLARAYSWAGRLGQARHHYEKVLPLAGERRHETLVGLATVQSWCGDLEDAERNYQTVLDEDPENTEALIGLATVTNWSGRHRTAEAIYHDALATDPANAEAIKGLAYAQYWSGRRSDAMATLQAGLSARDFEKTSASMEPGRVNGTNIFSYRDNSTDGSYRVFTTEARPALPVSTEVTARYDVGKLQQDGSPDISRDVLTLIVRQPVVSGLSVTAAPGFQWNRFDTPVPSATGGLIDDFDLFVWDVYATLTPIDWVRGDVGNARQTLDVPQPLFRRVHVTTTTAGLDWRLSRRFLTLFEAKYSVYSDDNARIAFGHRSEWLPFFDVPQPWRNAFTIIGGIEYSSSESETSSGYYSPSKYASLYGGVRFANDVTRKVRIEAEVRVGAEKEAGEPWTNIASFDGSARYRFRKSLDATVGVSAAGSRLDSPDGFRANRVYVGMDYLIGR